jgi:homogentisate 1,2-dioxygenase
MPIYHTLGQIPKKRHTAFRKPNGGIYAEELMGHEGFTGTSSLLYHTHPPTTVKSVRRVKEIAFEADDDRALRHRHFRNGAGEAGRKPDARPAAAPVQPGHAMLYVEPDEQDPPSTATHSRTNWCTWR